MCAAVKLAVWPPGHLAVGRKQPPRWPSPLARLERVGGRQDGGV